MAIPELFTGILTHNKITVFSAVDQMTQKTQPDTGGLVTRKKTSKTSDSTKPAINHELVAFIPARGGSEKITGKEVAVT